MKRSTKKRSSGLLIALTLVVVLAVAGVALAYSGSETWTGNGGDQNVAYSTQHWILTPGGGGPFVSAHLYVTFVGGGTWHGASSSVEDGKNGAAHFYVPVGENVVESAYAEFELTDEPNGNIVLTISGHETTTTTVGEETTTTVGEETTTTVGEETTTTGGVTTVSEIQTGLGGSTGLGAGIWGLGALALALAGGLGWTALRPALRKNK